MTTVQEKLIKARKEYKSLTRRYRLKRRGMRQRRAWGTLTHEEELQLLELGREVSKAKREYQAAQEESEGGRMYE